MSSSVELVITDNSLPSMDFRSLSGALSHLRSWGSVWNGKPWRIYRDGVIVREGVGNPALEFYRNNEEAK